MANIARIENNKNLNGIEIYFSVYPITGTRETLKKNGFKWNHKKNCWYAKLTENTAGIAAIIADTTIFEYENIAKQAGETVKQINAKKEANKKTPVKKATKKNKYGVKIGDYFSITWGYEQTNVNFLQVIALVGETSVRVREVNPPIIEEEATGPMAADRVYKLDKTKLLEPATYSVFIKDQENGDIKRITDKYINRPHFHVGRSEELADLETGETVKCYESWYY